MGLNHRIQLRMASVQQTDTLPLCQFSLRTKVRSLIVKVVGLLGRFPLPRNALTASSVETTTGIEPVIQSFANSCLTIRLCGHVREDSVTPLIWVSGSDTKSYRQLWQSHYSTSVYLQERLKGLEPLSACLEGRSITVIPQTLSSPTENRTLIARLKVLCPIRQTIRPEELLIGLEPTFSSITVLRLRTPC